jgi:hypothetical protein
MNPEDVPADLIEIASEAHRTAPQKRDGKPTRMRYALAAALTEFEQQIRDRVAAEILADQQRHEETHAPPGRPDALARWRGRREGMKCAAEVARGGS